jgi:hypothetical protein
MKTIVGLFQAKENALSSRGELTNLGVPQNQIRIVAKYAGPGALLGIAVADTFGLIIGLSALPVDGFGLRFLVIALIVFTGIGTALGGLLGALFGVDSIERVAALCTEGMQLEGVLEIIETSNDLAARAAAILQQTSAVAVEIYPELETG